MLPTTLALRPFFLAALGAAASAQVSVVYDAGTAGNPPTAPSPETQGWTRVDTAQGAVQETDVSPDGSTGLNAWQISDSTTAPHGLRYSTFLTQQQLDDLADTGWRYDLTLRMLDGPNLCIFFEYGTGATGADERYTIFFVITGNDVVATHFDSGTAFTCADGHDGEYHVFSVEKPAGAGNTDATFLYDGEPLGVFPFGQAISATTPGGFSFGAGSSSGVGTANFHRAEFQSLPEPLGQTYCNPAVPNSTGFPGLITALGSADVAANDLTLLASHLPVGEFGYFLASETQGSFMPAGSAGVLCLAGDIGRLNAPSQVIQGSVGSIQVDLTSIPVNPPVAVVPGDTWNFTCWYRDGATSNFTDAVSIAFQ